MPVLAFANRLLTTGHTRGIRRGGHFMANVHARKGWFHLLFRFKGRQYSHALKTKDRREAEAFRGSVDRMLIRLRNREIAAPIWR